MDELISRKALIKALDYARLHNIGVRDAVKSVPTVDAVKVVRCKDCDNNDGMYGAGSVWCNKLERGIMENCFCSFGVQKEEHND